MWKYFDGSMYCLVEIMRPLLAGMKENTNAQTRQSGAGAPELPRPYFPFFLVHVGSAVHAIVLMHDEKYGATIRCAIGGITAKAWKIFARYSHWYSTGCGLLLFVPSESWSIVRHGSRVGIFFTLPRWSTAEYRQRLFTGRLPRAAFISSWKKMYYLNRIYMHMLMQENPFLLNAEACYICVHPCNLWLAALLTWQVL